MLAWIPPGRRRLGHWIILGLALPLLAAAALARPALPPGLKAAAAALSAAASERRIPIYSVETTEPRVAISFDAAWGADRTEAILDILDRYGVKTTFFLVTFWVERYPDMAREIVARGHEIGMHSTSHPDMTALSRAQMRRELEENHRVIREITGFDARLFRPPFGAYNNTLIEVVEDELGFKTIQWSVDSLDWKDVDAAFIERRVLDRIGPGDIVLFHNNAEATPQALPRILERLQADGYEIVPISRLIYWDNYLINHEGRQVPLGR